VAIYTRTDLQHVLVGLVVMTVETHAANESTNLDHARGALSMARGVALSTGIAWPEVLISVRTALDVTGGELLPAAAALLEAS